MIANTGSRFQTGIHSHSWRADTVVRSHTWLVVDFCHSPVQAVVWSHTWLVVDRLLTMLF